MSLITDLVEFWALDEASGSRASEHGSHTLTEPDDPVESTTGHVYGTAASFVGDASSPFEYLQSSTGSGGGDDFTFSAARTIAFWLYTDAYHVVFRVPIAKGDGSTAEWRFYQSDAGNTGFIVNAASANAVEVANPSAANWHLVVGMYNPSASANGTIYIQIDNGSVSSQALGASLSTISSSYVRMGTNCVTGSVSQEHDGRLGPVMFWNRELTTDERTELYNSGSGLTYANFSSGRTFVLNRV